MAHFPEIGNCIRLRFGGQDEAAGDDGMTDEIRNSLARWATGLHYPVGCNFTIFSRNSLSRPCVVK